MPLSNGCLKVPVDGLHTALAAAVFNVLQSALRHTRQFGHSGRGQAYGDFEVKPRLGEWPLRVRQHIINGLLAQAQLLGKGQAFVTLKLFSDPYRHCAKSLRDLAPRKKHR